MSRLGSRQRLVEQRSGYAPAVGVDGLGKGRVEPLHPPTRLGTDLQAWGVRNEAQHVGHLRPDQVLGFVVEQVPLVEDDDDGVAGGVDPLGQPLVLLGDPLVGVDHDERQGCEVDGLQRTHHRVVLGAFSLLTPPPHAGGVDEAHRPISGFDHRVDGVAGGPRHVVDDCPFVAYEPVEKGRFTDIGPPDDRNRDGPRAASLSS